MKLFGNSAGWQLRTPRQPCCGGRQHVLWAGHQVAQDRLPLELCSLCARSSATPSSLNTPNFLDGCRELPCRCRAQYRKTGNEVTRQSHDPRFNDGNHWEDSDGTHELWSRARLTQCRRPAGETPTKSAFHPGQPLPAPGRPRFF